MNSLYCSSPFTVKRQMKIYQRDNLSEIPSIDKLSAATQSAIKAVSTVLPFRVNNYVVEDLIDWTNIPDDPIYQLTFPQEGMLDPTDFQHMLGLVNANVSDDEIINAAREIQFRLNPHPAGQMDLNVPKMNNEPLAGMQHKYRETVLFFPSAGQTCFSYCTYCFRWAQFVGIKGLKFASAEATSLVEYLKQHTEVRSVLITGGDPMIMRSELLRRYVEPLLAPELEHITSIRIGTKALAFWPYRFVTDDDADDLLRLFEQVRAAGKHMAIMAHYSHPRELETEIARAGLKRVLAAGATVRCQSPVIQHVNDSPAVWSRMWNNQVTLGAIPYYMFVERDTGAKRYFELPLVRGLEIFEQAYSNTTGLGRTVRGPSMSSTPGKVMVDGVQEINGEKVFVLKFLQARNPAWVNKVFFARFDPQATWLDQLKPAFGANEFFFEPEMRIIQETGYAQVWCEDKAEEAALIYLPHKHREDMKQSA